MRSPSTQRRPLPVSAGNHDPGGKAKPKWPPGATVRAKFSRCSRYRYELTETWDKNLPSIMFLLMNPSVAGPEHADPTLIKCGRFARAWGYGGQIVGNVHAYRSTDKNTLVRINDPVGPQNDANLVRMARNAGIVVLAYGLPPKPLRPRAQSVVAALAEVAQLTYLRLTKDGTPEHPLYLPADLTPKNFVTPTDEPLQLTYA